MGLTKKKLFVLRCAAIRGQIFLLLGLIAFGFCSTTPAMAGVAGGYNASSYFGQAAQVQIYIRGTYNCTGSAISTTWILTAKHCFHPTGAPAATPGDVGVTSDTVYLTSTNLKGADLIAENPNLDAALVHLTTPTSPANTIAYGVNDTGLSYPATIKGWGKTTIDNTGAPAPRLQTSEHTVGVVPDSLPSTVPTAPLMFLYAREGASLQFGDSGAGVRVYGLLCGVFTTTSSFTPNIGFAVRTSAIAQWIFTISQVPASPYRSCNHPDSKRVVLTTPLRVMPLGASITQGIQSSDGLGYRNDLLMQLAVGAYPNGQARVSRSASTQTTQDASGPRPASALTLALEGGLTSGAVEMVGRKQDGPIADDNDEGYPGYRIDQVAGVAACAVPYFQPNLVTLLVGTNDIQQNYNLGEAPARLGGLIDQILNESPKAVVLVASIPPNTDPANPQFEIETMAYNSAIEQVVAERADAGKHVIFVSSGVDPSQISSDHIHPVDAGYDEISAEFLSGASDAADLGWFQNPDAGGTLPAGCSLSAASGGGTGNSPGSTDTRWQDTGVSFTDGFGMGNSYRWADVNKDKKPEFFVVKPDQSWSFYWNGGPANNTEWTSWGLGVTRAARASGLVGNALRFADIDGDGEADCVQIDLQGHLQVWVWDNTKPVGEKICGKPTTLETNVLKTGQIAPTTTISFADIDGDGLVDYILTDQYGAARVWFNKPKNAQYNTPFSIWWAPTQISYASATSPRIFRWADLDGDGKADLILITANGGANAWLNKGLNNSGQVVLHNIGTIATDKDLPPVDIQFVDVDGDGKADFVRTGWTGVTHIWLNRLTSSDFAK